MTGRIPATEFSPFCLVMNNNKKKMRGKGGENANLDGFTI
jgi:hypothetical protein